MTHPPPPPPPPAERIFYGLAQCSAKYCAPPPPPSKHPGAAPDPSEHLNANQTSKLTIMFNCTFHDVKQCLLKRFLNVFNIQGSSFHS